MLTGEPASQPSFSFLQDGIGKFCRSLGLKRQLLAHPVFSRPLRWLSLRNRIPASILSGIVLRETIRVELPTGESFRYAAQTNEGIDMLLYWYGLRSWEIQSVGVFSKLVRQAKGRVVDIGAHKGIYTLISCAINPGIRVSSFEPVPETNQEFLRNIALNSWEGRVDVRRVALSNEPGHAQFQIPEDATMAGLVSSGPAKAACRTIDVEVVTGDDLISDPVDVIKMDVEGAEALVLQGMNRILRESRPSVLFECLENEVGAAVERQFLDLGYQLFRIDHTGLRSVEHIIPADAEERNFVAIHPSRNIELS